MTDKTWRDKYLDDDPLANVKVGLLNSQEIRQYAHLGLLVSDFDENRLKSASYEMEFLGELHKWDFVNGRPEKKTISLTVKGERETLQSNSITYISLHEEFRLPHYMAARFNLHIRHVHKGLLLGTGPLVDPGFEGHLLIPLHNLTENDYDIKIGEGLIWVEFTKLNEAADKPFPPEKLNLPPMQYFDRAGILEKGGVLSSIKTTLEISRKAAEEQLETSREAADKQTAFISKIEKISMYGGAIVLITLVLAISGLIATTYQLTLTAQQISSDSADMLVKAESTFQEIQVSIEQQSKANVDIKGVTQIERNLDRQASDVTSSTQLNGAESSVETLPAQKSPED